MTTTDPKPLTARQAQVLEFIRANSGLYGPTVREIALAFSIRSPNGVVCHLKALEKKGLIKRTPYSSRGIEVVR
jgi:repressor LexA